MWALAAGPQRRVAAGQAFAGTWKSGSSSGEPRRRQEPRPRNRTPARTDGSGDEIVLDRPTSLEFVGDRAPVVSLSGQVVTIKNVSPHHWGTTERLARWAWVHGQLVKKEPCIP